MYQQIYSIKLKRNYNVRPGKSFILGICVNRQQLTLCELNTSSIMLRYSYVFPFTEIALTYPGSIDDAIVRLDVLILDSSKWALIIQLLSAQILLMMLSAIHCPICRAFIYCINKPCKYNITAII